MSTFVKNIQLFRKQNYLELRHLQNQQWSTKKVQKGREFAKKGDTEEAIKQFSSAIHTDPECYNAFFHRGCAYANKGCNNEACKDFEKVLEFIPDHYSALSYLEQCTRRLKEDELLKTHFSISTDITSIDFQKKEKETRLSYLKAHYPELVSEDGKSTDISKFRVRLSHPKGHNPTKSKFQSSTRLDTPTNPSSTWFTESGQSQPRSFDNYTTSTESHAKNIISERSQAGFNQHLNTQHQSTFYGRPHMPVIKSSKSIADSAQNEFETSSRFNFNKDSADSHQKPLSRKQSLYSGKSWSYNTFRPEKHAKPMEYIHGNSIYKANASNQASSNTDNGTSNIASINFSPPVDLNHSNLLSLDTNRSPSSNQTKGQPTHNTQKDSLLESRKASTGKESVENQVLKSPTFDQSPKVNNNLSSPLSQLIANDLCDSPAAAPRPTNNEENLTYQKETFTNNYPTYSTNHYSSFSSYRGHYFRGDRGSRPYRGRYHRYPTRGYNQFTYRPSMDHSTFASHSATDKDTFQATGEYHSTYQAPRYRPYYSRPPPRRHLDSPNGS
jgi:tetratricopeptide (TPR) repeat protein